jgi:predicted dehydrogenase
MLSPLLFRSRVIVRGDAGELRVTNPYHPHWFHAIQVRTSEGARKENVGRVNHYECQLRAFVRSIRDGAPIVTDAANGVATMRVIDAIYDHAGLKRRGM